jgi:osmotically-inducible protein OsmY
MAISVAQSNLLERVSATYSINGIAAATIRSNLAEYFLCVPTEWLTQSHFSRKVSLIPGWCRCLAGYFANQVTESSEGLKMKRFAALAILTALTALGPACSNQNSVTYKDNVERALQQADLKDVTVAEDREKNTITLGGTLHSDEAKSRAADIAKSAATTRIIANEISVQPVGAESEAKDAAAAWDDGIEKNYKAALITSRLNKQHISYTAKNGVLTLTGKVKTPGERQQAQQLAAAIPHVQQVLNQIDVRR